MPADSVTLYNSKGETLDLANDPSLLKSAAQKGWLPKGAPRQPSPGASPQMGAPATGTASNVRIPNRSFAGGFDAGFNPVHQAPAGTPPVGGPSMAGQVGNAAASGFNIPEIMQLLRQKNYSGAGGMALGTASGAGAMAGGEIAKGMGMAERAGADVVRSSASAMRGAAESAELKMNSAITDFAERNVAHIKEALDKQFEPLHQILNGKAVPFGPKIERIINSLSESEIPQIRRFAEDLMEHGPETTRSVTSETSKAAGTAESKVGTESTTKAESAVTGKSVEDIKTKKTGPGQKQVTTKLQDQSKGLSSKDVEATTESATKKTGSREVAKETTKESVRRPVKAGMWYEDARQLKQDIHGLMQDTEKLGATRYNSKLKALSKEIDNEIGGLAKQQGVGDLHTKLTSQWKQVEDIKRAIAYENNVTGKGGAGRTMSVPLGSSGVRMPLPIQFEEGGLKVPKTAQRQLDKLAKETGAGSSGIKPGAMEKTGTALKRGGAAHLGGSALIRAILQMMTGDPHAGQQAQ